MKKSDVNVSLESDYTGYNTFGSCWFGLDPNI